MYNWISLLYTWNLYNIVNQIYSNIKLKKNFDGDIKETILYLFFF